jgi:hypothetical protein
MADEGNRGSTTGDKNTLSQQLLEAAFGKERVQDWERRAEEWIMGSGSNETDASSPNQDSGSGNNTSGPEDSTDSGAASPPETSENAGQSSANVEPADNSQATRSPEIVPIPGGQIRVYPDQDGNASHMVRDVNTGTDGNPHWDYGVEVAVGTTEMDEMLSRINPQPAPAPADEDGDAANDPLPGTGRGNTADGTEADDDKPFYDKYIADPLGNAYNKTSKAADVARQVEEELADLGQGDGILGKKTAAEQAAEAASETGKSGSAIEPLLDLLGRSKSATDSPPSNNPGRTPGSGGTSSTDRMDPNATNQAITSSTDVLGSGRSIVGGGGSSSSGDGGTGGQGGGTLGGSSSDVGFGPSPPPGSDDGNDAGSGNSDDDNSGSSGSNTDGGDGAGSDTGNDGSGDADGFSWEILEDEIIITDGDGPPGVATSGDPFDDNIRPTPEHMQWRAEWADWQQRNRTPFDPADDGAYAEDRPDDEEIPEIEGVDQPGPDGESRPPADPGPLPPRALDPLIRPTDDTVMGTHEGPETNSPFDDPMLGSGPISNPFAPDEPETLEPQIAIVADFQVNIRTPDRSSSELVEGWQHQDAYWDPNTPSAAVPQEDTSTNTFMKKFAAEEDAGSQGDLSSLLGSSETSRWRPPDDEDDQLFD